jgi:hypothetical protein
LGLGVNEDAALLAAIEAHVALQHQRELTDAFPLDPDVFDYLYPEPRVPAPLRTFIERIGSSTLGFGVYRGRFQAGPEHLVLVMDTDGDHGYLCVFDEALTLVACACRQVERLRWVSLEELLPFARSATPHPLL